MEVLLILLGLIQFITTVIVLIYEFKNKSILMVLWGTLLIMFSFPHLISCLYENTEYSIDVMVSCSAFAFLFEMIYLVVRFSMKKNPNMALKTKTTDLIVTRKERVFCTSAVFIAFLVYCIYLTRNAGNIFDMTWFSSRVLGSEVNIYEDADFSYLMYYLSGYLISAFFGVLVYYLLEKKWFVSCVCVLVICAHVLISKTRANLLPIFLVVVFFIFMKNKKSDFKLIRNMCFFAVLGLVVVYFVQGIRLSGSLTNFFSNGNYISVLKDSIKSIGDTSSSGELGLRDAFYYFVSKNNDFPGFGQLKSYIGLLFLPIPVSLSFGLKPVDFAITMGQAYSGNYSIDYFSMHPTLFGDCYANLGFAGCFLGAFWAIFLTIVENRINNASSSFSKILYTMALGSSLFLVGRGSVYFGCRQGFIVILIIWLVSTFFWENGRIKFVFKRKRS